jgi:hypothetical protein
MNDENSCAKFLNVPVDSSADSSCSDAVELLGVVMAHEIGHLLLPPGSHVEYGLMRGRWDYRDIRDLNRLDLDFSAAQAEQIRGALGLSLGAQ